VTSRHGVVTLVAVAVVALGGGLYAGTRIVTPRQAAADARPPAASIVTARLEKHTLTEQLVARGRPTAAGGVTLNPPPGLAGDAAVVTSVKVKTGDRLRDGQVVLDIGGAPLIVATMPFRLYRDISVGDHGPDVDALSRVLVRHGYLGRTTGTATTAMRAAAWRFLADRGYPGLLGGTATDPAGLVMRQSWLIRTDKDGRRVSRVRVAVGSVLTDPAAALLDCDVTPPEVDSRWDEDAAGRIHVGDAALVVDEADNRTVPAVVRSVAAAASADAATNVTGRLIVLAAADGETFAGLADDVKVTVDAAVSATPVLAAPTTAVYTDESGASHVVLADGDRAGASVPVTLGACVAGWCQLMAPPANLSAGTVVVAGVGGQS
jgi:hypothetical protein